MRTTKNRAKTCIAGARKLHYFAFMGRLSFRSKFAFSIAALLLLAGVWALASAWVQKEVLTRLGNSAEVVARQQTKLLDSELARYRLLAIVLAEYSDLEEALTKESPEVASRLNDRLASLVSKTGASIIYIINEYGRVVSSSNAHTAESFIGRNYGFRPYFTDALSAGSAEYYAVGDLSGRPGLFFSRQIGDTARAQGVAVIKFEFQALVKGWTKDLGETFIVDPSGVVLASTDPDEELRTFRVLSATERAHLTESGQFSNRPLEPSLLSFETNGMMAGPSDTLLLPVEERISETTLRLVHAVRANPALDGARELAFLISIAATIILAAIAMAIYWQLTRTMRMAADRAELEVAVTARTAELHAQIIERETADRRFREAREELAQANRLAILGSVTAGLIHQINQPVAAIRTLAENARHHLLKDRIDRVSANLLTAVELTARIGTITQEMLRFARRGKGENTRVDINETIAGALLLLGERFHSADVHLELPGSDLPDVVANRVQLEQVLVNLLQNALDAVADRSDPRVLISADMDASWVSLIVADNGPGIDPRLAENIFNPFVTTKAEGLGLGLSIARDIVAELNGVLDVMASPLGGAAFVVRMRKA